MPGYLVSEGILAEYVQSLDIVAVNKKPRLYADKSTMLISFIQYI